MIAVAVHREAGFDVSRKSRHLERKDLLLNALDESDV